MSPHGFLLSLRPDGYAEAVISRVEVIVGVVGAQCSTATPESRPPALPGRSYRVRQDRR